MKKSEYRKFKVKYLGHIVGSSKLLVDYEKVQFRKDWSAFTCIKELQQSLGFEV